MSGWETFGMIQKFDKELSEKWILQNFRLKFFIDFVWLMANISERFKVILEAHFTGQAWYICSSSADTLIS